MRIKIAICDDEQEICSNIYLLLNKISSEKLLDFQIDCFTSGEELCREIEQTDYSLIFLDIALPKMNGVEVGKYIRNNLQNENVQIAYISSNQEYAMELFESRPINFLVKPLSYEKIQKVIDKFLLISEIDTRIFSFKNGREYIKLPLSNILYFMSNRRKITIVTQSDNYEFYGSLEKIYSQIKNSKFLYVHKSFIVNYRFIKNYEYEQVIMTDGKIVSISQSRRKAIRIMFIKIKEEEL